MRTRYQQQRQLSPVAEFERLARHCRGLGIDYFRMSNAEMRQAIASHGTKMPEPVPAPVAESPGEPSSTRPATRVPRTDGRCDTCGRLAVLAKVDANGWTSCYECREEACDVCKRTGRRRSTRRDDVTICEDCSKREDEAAEYQAWMKQGGN